MTRARERRPRPEPVGAEEDAEIEAKYRQLYRFIKRLGATQARDREGDDDDPEAPARRR